MPASANDAAYTDRSCWYRSRTELIFPYMGKIYLCVHLGRTDGMNVSSPLAKEIAIQIVSDYYGR